MDSGIECTLRNFADNTKLCGVVDTLEGKEVIQEDLDKVERWVHANLMNATRPSTRFFTWVGAIPSTGWEENGERLAKRNSQQTEEVIVSLCSTPVRSQLERCIQVWVPT
ncbi:hypothetical protein WISP_84224 [Willisornis vidua]|uniref:Rna-directed dna polymerase from mobile element jockey-like n=1 Tax=Willisornis vidua TaxID=1566151 RepID=A0ABQ9D3L1_9PASS|nr:hypothetical protein WISP_84224 [Willisornis vidua]